MWHDNNIQSNKFSSIENLREKYKELKIHVRNMQVLVTEMLKFKNSIAPQITSDIFKLSNPSYNLRSKRDFVSNHVKTVYFGTESPSYLGSDLWYLISRLENINVTNKVRVSSKKMVPQNCPYRICKVFIQNVAFI